jgi:oligoribonuclease (3'-5' exoribonuclease)
MSEADGMCRMVGLAIDVNHLVAERQMQVLKMSTHTHKHARGASMERFRGQLFTLHSSQQLRNRCLESKAQKQVIQHSWKAQVPQIDAPVQVPHPV